MTNVGHFSVGSASYLAMLDPRWTCWDCTQWRITHLYPPHRGALSSQQVRVAASHDIIGVLFLAHECSWRRHWRGERRGTLYWWTGPHTGTRAGLHQGTGSCSTPWPAVLLAHYTYLDEVCPYIMFILYVLLSKCRQAWSMASRRLV